MLSRYLRLTPPRLSYLGISVPKVRNAACVRRMSLSIRRHKHAMLDIAGRQQYEGHLDEKSAAQDKKDLPLPNPAREQALNNTRSTTASKVNAKLPSTFRTRDATLNSFVIYSMPGQNARLNFLEALSGMLFG